MEEEEKPRRSKKEQNRRRGSSNPIAVAHSRRGGAGSGPHTQRPAHSSRHQKHKRPWHEYQDLDEWEDDSEE
jgi:hypothetical protein